ncbi:MAG: isoprenylcysteine carboxylmethyltransferase family protein [Candidatus Lokiarchaeota archaeon]|nr:isoprenylcysteine carboxylmethyltransferase family protein [Candidatus Lokiarchaeota archaeon]
MIMIISSFLLTIFYIKSVQPALLEKKIGEGAFKRCYYYRIIASSFMGIILITQIIYFYYPLPLNFPRFFPWHYWVSFLIAILIAIPSLIIMFKGVHDAGEETIKPSKNHSLYDGIYNKVRHPQALGELGIWWIVPLLLNSPFLGIFSLIWIPIFYLFCLYEEKDLKLRYGEAYLEYKKKTGMIFPKIKSFNRNR